MVAHAGVGQDRDVAAFLDQIGLVQGTGVVPFRNLFREVVKQHVLEEQHGVVVANRRLHQALGVRWGADRHDLDAGHRMEVGLEALAVLSPELTAHAAGTANHGGNREVAATGVAEHPHVVGDLVEREQQEAHVHAFDDGPKARHRGTDGHAGEGVLCNRGIQNPQFAVLLVEILRDLVGTAVLTDVFPHHADMGITGHLFVDGLTQGVEEKGLCHG